MAVLFPLLLLLATATRTVGAHERARGQRRRLAPSESIRRYLSEENENGEMEPKFSLSSVVDVDGEPDQYDVDVVQALPAVTSRTTYSIRGGPHHPIGDLGVKFLVQDRSIRDEDDGVNYAETKQTTFALIAVDENSGMIHGIAKKQGEKAMNIQQLNDGALTAAILADDFVPPKDFRCQATQREVRGDHSGQLHEHNHDETTHEHIFSEHDIDHLVADHEHPTPQYSAQSEPETGFPSAPSHQVDLYIEIDQSFIELNGNNQTEAFKYVSALVTAASQIYEFELNTRLTVAHIEVTDHYENYTLAADVLERMVELYGDLNEWHYTDGNGVDLHHAILGQTLDGGIAYIETVCDSNYGFAVSPNMRGTFESLDFATVWDTSVLAHEVGHSFGAYHTHDYRPPVDRCYHRNSYSTCPSESQLEDAATLMSYCDSCPGADPSSLAYTFGGQFVGHDPTNVDDWQNTQTLIGSFNFEPKRVAHGMYAHVSSRTCTQPNFSCTQDSECNDYRECSIDKCNLATGQCERTVQQDCCGNGVCEPNELPCADVSCDSKPRACKDDCGPFYLETKECFKCKAKRGRGNGIMFDTQNLLSEAVIINSLDFRHTQTQSSTVTIYTTDGSYISQATDSDEWIALTTGEVSINGRKGGYVTIDFDFPVAILPESTRAFYIASTGKLISGQKEDGVNHLALDNTLSVPSPARIVGTTPFGGGVQGSWDGKLNYSINPRPQASMFDI